MAQEPTAGVLGAFAVVGAGFTDLSANGDSSAVVVARNCASIDAGDVYTQSGGNVVFLSSSRFTFTYVLGGLAPVSGLQVCVRFVTDGEYAVAGTISIGEHNLMSA